MQENDVQINDVECLRNDFLKLGLIQAYEAFLTFMRFPNQNNAERVLESIPPELEPLTQTELNAALALYSEDKRQYEYLYSYGQVIIWDEVLNTYKTILHQIAIIDSISLSPDCSNYTLVLDELKQLLTPYAQMQIALSDLESVLGVDRFLDRISEDTFAVLTSLLQDAKHKIEDKSKQFKTQAQIRYSTTNVYTALAHSLIQANENNQVCDLISSGKDQVLLLVIDGLGFCQYLWNKGIDSKHQNYTFKENVFSWLSKNNLLREMILGSSFVTDTGAGLANIFLGKKASSTGVFASKIRNETAGTPYIETKRINRSLFDSLFSCPNSITDVLATFNKESTIYYCSRYQDPPSGFSSHLFESAEVIPILPAERVFSIVLDDIFCGKTSGLQVVYLTGIDNNGHTTGAYSAFEKQEHLKMDSLLRNFLIELAYFRPELFDGKRSIMITADHGMYESSKKMISRQDIISSLNYAGIRNIKLIENNRALLFYNEGYSDTEYVATVLRDYFRTHKFDVDVQTAADKGFYECLCSEDNDDKRPSIIARIIGEGLFFSRPDISEHLLHYGGHGGYSVDEVFVPLIEIPLNSRLLAHINTRFLSKK